jgi:endonuclease-3
VRVVFSRSRAARRSRAATIADRLAELYPEAGTSLPDRRPLAVLIGTILSAQCTDRKVNEVLPDLLAAYPDAAAFAGADLRRLEPYLRPLGLHRSKAKSLRAACGVLVEEHDGEVPQDFAALTALPGVGRKTAHCVRVNAFGLPGLMTDTHFCRVTRRLGLTDEEDPAKIEADLAALLPAERWGAFSHRIIRHGRAICTARTPRCDECPLRRSCEYGRRHA